MLHHDVGTNNHDTIRMINLIEIMMLILNVILLITITTMGECNGNTRLVGSQGSTVTETYPGPSTTRTCITRRPGQA